MFLLYNTLCFYIGRVHIQLLIKRDAVAYLRLKDEVVAVDTALALLQHRQPQVPVLQARDALIEAREVLTAYHAHRGDVVMML